MNTVTSSICELNVYFVAGDASYTYVEHVSTQAAGGAVCCTARCVPKFVVWSTVLSWCKCIIIIYIEANLEC